MYFPESFHVSFRVYLLQTYFCFPACLIFLCYSHFKIIFLCGVYIHYRVFHNFFWPDFFSKSKFSQQVNFLFIVFHFQSISNLTIYYFSKVFPSTYVSRYSTLSQQIIFPNTSPKNAQLTNHNDYQLLTFFPCASLTLILILLKG